jgi:SAM-dependent methyltransferase
MSSHYIHGTDPMEQKRLSLMNSILNDESFRRAGIQPGERIIDFGCGLGQLTRRMAAAAGVAALGIERSEEQAAQASRLAESAGEKGLIEIRIGDASAPPLSAGEWGSFDVAHARFLLEHVPDPLSVVRQMVAALRPGGRLILEDDDHDVLRFWPEAPAAMRLWNAYIESYPRLGNDPAIGRKLPSYIAAAGALPLRNDWVFFGGCRGDQRFEAIVANMAGILRGARSTLTELHLLSEEEHTRGLKELEQWSEKDGAAIWFAMAWAEGTKRA